MVTSGGTPEAAEQAVRSLSAEDRNILALETETVAGHTCKVIVLADEIDPVALRALVASRLELAPLLCTCLCDVDGAPCWASGHALELDSHVVAVEGVVDQVALREIVAGLFEQRLDRSVPLWRMDVVPRLTDGGSAVIWRIHHALADGSTAMRMAQAVLWDEVLADQAGARRQARRPAGPAAAARDRRVRLARVRAAARELPQPWRRSPFNGSIGAHRSVAVASVKLRGLRLVARAVDGATVNDAVLTVVAGGLRRWLEAHHGRLGAVRVKVPVSLHAPSTPGQAAPESEPGNRDSFFCLDLPLVADPIARLAAIRRATRIRKDGHDAQQLDALMHRLGRVPRLAQFADHVLTHPRSFALNVSNVPGPRRPVAVLGVPVRAMYSLAEIREHHALRVAVVSLANTLNFGLVADPTLLPSVDVLARGIEDEAAALVARLRYV